MRLYLLSAYAGFILLFMRKRYVAVAFILTCLVSGLSTYPSHIEYRYIVPFYWIISLLVGYLFYDIMNRIFNSYYKRRLFMEKYIVLLLLATSAVRCDVTMDDFAANAELEQDYKKAKKRDEHCNRVAQRITEVVTVKRCEDIVRDFASANSQELRRTAGTILDDIRARTSAKQLQRSVPIV
jgi:hypothetical protein